MAFLIVSDPEDLRWVKLGSDIEGEMDCPKTIQNRAVKILRGLVSKKHSSATITPFRLSHDQRKYVEYPCD